VSLLIILALTTLLCPVAAVLGRRAGRDAGWPLAAGLLVLAGALVAVWNGRGDSDEVSQQVPWMPTLDVPFHLRLDGLGLFFGLIVLVIGAVVIGYSARYLAKGSHSAFYTLMTFFAAAMLGLVLADDVVLLFVMWEFTTLCSFLLIARSGPHAKDPAIRTFLVTVAGGLCLLTAVIAMWVATGTTRLSDILVDDVWSTSPGFAAFVAVLIALAAFTKSAQFPFHAWLPDAMVAITPVSAYLHAAAMVKAGIYLMLRFSTALSEVPVWNVLLISVGLFTALMGAVFALQRHDLKELLAYSTVSQLGFLTATIGIGTSYAVVGAVVHVAAHALFKSALFMSVGVIDHQTGSRDIRRLSGLARTMPVTAVVMTLAAVSMAGVPPLFGFISKEAMFKAMAESPAPPGAVWLVGAVAVLAASFTFAYSARMIITIFPGRPAQDPPKEASAAFLAPVVLVSVAGLALGLAGVLAEPLLGSAAAAVAGPDAEPHLGLWHGFAPELYMSLAVFALGGALVLARGRTDRLLDRELSPITGVGAVEAFRSGSIALGEWVGGLTRADAPYRHLVPPMVVLVLLTVVGLFTVDVPPLHGPVTQPLDWVLLGVVVVGVVLALGVRSRIALVTIVGVVGFAVALWFYDLGAADVALTQLLVEILTVVVIVLLLNRLPSTFHRTGKRRTTTAAVLAVVAGASAAVAVWALTGRRGLSDAGQYFLTEGESETGGTNVVNTILVDFRALDTLGELTVLGVAGIAIVVALESRGLLPKLHSPITEPPDSPISDARDNTMILRVTDRLLGPVIIVLSLFFLLRGHNDPGGGFISALIGAAGISLVYLAAQDDRVSRLGLPYVKLIGAGVVVAVGVGLLGLVEGSFLRPLHFYLFDVHITTALIFDVGVYLAVVGVILAAISRLGVEEKEPPPLRRVGSTAVPSQGPRSTSTTDEPHHPSTAPLDVSRIRILEREPGRPGGTKPETPADRTDRPRGDDS
jgi:multicomponent Na+:H+ antiporter subunit A